MDTITLVENNIDDGQLLVEQFVADGNSVTVAFWVVTADEGLLFLCIATEMVERQGTTVAAEAIHRSLRKLSEPWVRMTEINMVGPNHPMTRSVLTLLSRHPGPLPARFGPQTLGSLSVEEVYVYPRQTVKVTIYHLVFPSIPDETGILLSLDPLLLDGHFSEEVERQGIIKEYRGNTGIDCVVAAPEGSQLERDENGKMVLAWNLRGNRRQSSANEVWSLAKLGLQGFRFYRKPGATDEYFENHSVQRN